MNLGHDASHAETPHINSQGGTTSRADPTTLAGGGDGFGLAPLALLVDLDSLIRTKGLADSTTNTEGRIHFRDNGRRSNEALGQGLTGRPAVAWAWAMVSSMLLGEWANHRHRCHPPANPPVAA